jgi:hypothetical protein
MRTLSLTFHLLLPAAVRSDFNCRGVLSQSPKGKRISDLNATLVKHGENGAQRMVQLDALSASSYKVFVEDEDDSLICLTAAAKWDPKAVLAVKLDPWDIAEFALPLTINSSKALS